MVYELFECTNLYKTVSKELNESEEAGLSESTLFSK